jgi:hypothetical protein
MRLRRRRRGEEDEGDREERASEQVEQERIKRLWYFRNKKEPEVGTKRSNFSPIHTNFRQVGHKFRKICRYWKKQSVWESLMTCY